ncbi:hypothetical protein ACP70R_039880 [Stipagrostis hirtigluma subsp. patula]
MPLSRAPPRGRSSKARAFLESAEMAEREWRGRVCVAPRDEGGREADTLAGGGEGLRLAGGALPPRLGGWTSAHSRFRFRSRFHAAK